MPNGLPEPALSPLHPDKPEPPIVTGAIWIKKASGKTSVNAPQITIFRTYADLKTVEVKPVNFRTGHGWVEGHWPWGARSMRIEILRRDWRPC
jgi:hypothetical protein